jgi:hypothetical protein
VGWLVAVAVSVGASIVGRGIDALAVGVAKSDGAEVSVGKGAVWVSVEAGDDVVHPSTLAKTAAVKQTLLRLVIGLS